MNCAPKKRRVLLKFFVNAFEEKDRLSINNSVFLGQRLKLLPVIYDDFEVFGKLGVSSFKLNLDYSLLPEKVDYKIRDKKVKSFEETGRYMSKFSSDELRLVSCVFWNEGRFLNKKEQEIARRIKDRVQEGLPFL